MRDSRDPMKVMKRIVIMNTLRNLRKYMEEQHNNISAKNFSGHMGFMGEIRCEENIYILKVLLNAPRTELYFQIMLMNRVSDKHLADVLRAINDRFSDTIIGRVDVEDHIVTAQASINLETYMRRLAEFASLKSINAKIFSEAAPLFCPDSELFEMTEMVLMTNIKLIENEVEAICGGKSYDKIKKKKEKKQKAFEKRYGHLENDPDFDQRFRDAFRHLIDNDGDDGEGDKDAEENGGLHELLDENGEICGLYEELDEDPGSHGAGGGARKLFDDSVEDTGSVSDDDSTGEAPRVSADNAGPEELEASDEQTVSDEELTVSDDEIDHYKTLKLDSGDTLSVPFGKSDAVRDDGDSVKDAKADLIRRLRDVIENCLPDSTGGGENGELPA